MQFISVVATSCEELPSGRSPMDENQNAVRVVHNCNGGLHQATNHIVTEARKQAKLDEKNQVITRCVSNSKHTYS